MEGAAAWRLLLAVAAVGLALVGGAAGAEVQPSTLPLNTAAIRFRNPNATAAWTIMWRAGPCLPSKYNCLPQLLLASPVAPGNTSVYVNVTTSWRIELVIVNAAANATEARFQTHLGERGAYTLTVPGAGKVPVLTTELTPEWPHGASPLPAVYFFTALAFAVLFVVIARRVRRRQRQALLGDVHDDLLGEGEGLPLLEPPVSPSSRGTSPPLSPPTSPTTPLGGASRSFVLSPPPLSSASKAAGERTLNSGVRARTGTGSGGGSSNSSTQGAYWRRHTMVVARYLPLDIFRGLTVTLYVFWFLGGGGYDSMMVAPWGGLQFADLGPGFFLFAMGAGLVLSYNRRIVCGAPRPELLRRTVLRSLLLFGLGLVLENRNPGPFTSWRLMGPLQRAAVVNLVLGFLIVLARPQFAYFLECNPPPLALKGVRLAQVKDKVKNSLMARLRLQPHGRIAFLFLDTLPYQWEWICILAFGLMYIIVVHSTKLSGCPHGYLGPAGISDLGRHAACPPGGAIGHIDRRFFGRDHLDGHRKDSALQALFDGGPFDDYGLLSTLNACVMGYLGVQAGHTLLHFRGRLPPNSYISRFAAWSFLLGMIGLGLSFAEPINRSLFSTSYVAVTGSVCFLVLGAICLLVDRFKAWPGGFPLSAMGRNPLLIYLGSALLVDYFPFNLFYIRDDTVTRDAQFWHDILGTVVWILISVWLGHRKVQFAL